MLESTISFSSIYWISYSLWISLQIFTDSSNFVFSIKIIENVCEQWEITETNKWVRLLIFGDKS